MKKILYLFLALLLPALVFIFLKFAGRNEFNIPIYYEQGVVNPPNDCHQDFSSPYRVQDSILGLAQHEANVVVFPVEGLDLIKLGSSIETEFGIGVVTIIDASVASRDVLTMNQWKKCDFIVNEPAQGVLVDKERRIRGYYDLRLRDEVDRLRVELKILLKKY